MDTAHVPLQRLVFPWTLAVNAGTSICLRQVREDAVYEAIGHFGVTHFCGAPVVLNTLLNAPDELKRLVKQPVKTMMAGAAPPAAVIQGMQEQGVEVTHVYGLTETYGPVTLCAWREDLWGALDSASQSNLKSRQGVGGQMLENSWLPILRPCSRCHKTVSASVK